MIDIYVNGCDTGTATEEMHGLGKNGPARSIWDEKLVRAWDHFCLTKNGKADQFWQLKVAPA